jgi:hypothetical protein
VTEKMEGTVLTVVTGTDRDVYVVAIIASVVIN